MADSSGYAGIAGNVPESVRARIAAARLLAQAAAAPNAPYTSGAVTGLKAIEGLMGGLGERQALNEAQQGQAAQRQLLAQVLLNGTPNAFPATSVAPPVASSSSAPASTPAGSSSAPIATYSHNAFIQSALPEAQRISAQTGVDPRLIVAQAALESNYGRSAPGGNLFGIKATGGQPSTGPIATKEAVNGALTPTTASFAAYDSPGASFDGYGKLISGPRYASVRNGATLNDQIAALGRSGYATDPNYAAKVGVIARGIDPGINQAPQTAAGQLPSVPGSAAVPSRPPPPPGGDPGINADLPASNAQPVASNALPPGITPDMVSAPPPSPFGGPPQQVGGVAASPVGPDVQNSPAAPDLSPNGLRLGVQGLDGVDPGIAAQFQAGLQSLPPPASGLSTAARPGFDNIAPDGSVVPSLLGGGYAGGTRGMQATINGGAAQPAGTAPSSGPVPTFAAAAANPPAVLAAALRAPPQAQPATSPGDQAAGDDGQGDAAVPLPPPRPSDAQLGLSPDAPAPNAQAAGPAPAPAALAAMLRQPNGVAGNSAAADPNSPQSFNMQEAARAAGQPSAATMGAMLRGNTSGATSSSAQAPAPGGLDVGGLLGGMGGGGGNPLSGIPGLGSLFGGGGGGGLGNLLGGLGGGSGGPFGGSAPSAQTNAPQALPAAAQGAPAPGAPTQGGVDQRQLMALLSNPYTTPQEAEFLINRLSPQPVKLAAGEGLAGRRPDGSYGNLYTQPNKAEYDFNPATGILTNRATGEQRQAQPPQGDFGMTRDGVVYDKRTGQVSGGTGTGYRFLTQAEKQAQGLPLDQPVQVGPNGQVHAVSGQTINVGGEQNVYDNALSKQLADNHVGLMNGIEANRSRLRDLNAMAGAVQRIQQNGGTTGIGQEELLHLKGALNTGANALGLDQQFDTSDPELLNKLNTQLAGLSAKATGARGATNFDMQLFTKANPGLELSPSANQRILGIMQQQTQRDIEIGDAMQNAAAAAVAQGRRIDPQAMEKIRQDYDAAHHVVDPVTGQDLSASPRLPDLQTGQAQAAAAQGSAPAAPTLAQIQAEIARRRAAAGGR